MELSIYTIGHKIQVSGMNEDGELFFDYRLTIDEAESMVRKLNQSISDLRFKSNTKPYAKSLEVVSIEHTETGLTMKYRINTEKWKR